MMIIIHTFERVWKYNLWGEKQCGLHIVVQDKVMDRVDEAIAAIEDAVWEALRNDLALRGIK